jgi:hypothetical protein
MHSKLSPTPVPYSEGLSEFTHILERVENGDQKAAAELVPFAATDESRDFPKSFKSV